MQSAWLIADITIVTLQFLQAEKQKHVYKLASSVILAL